MAVVYVAGASALTEHTTMLYGNEASDFHSLIPFKGNKVITTHICRAETTNAMLGLKRGNKISRAQFVRCIDWLNSMDGMDMQTDNNPCWKLVIELSDKHGLNIYDAIYLELAMKLAKSHLVVLATFDKALVRAAKAEGIRLLYQRN